jgi:hypothetical protein
MPDFFDRRARVHIEQCFDRHHLTRGTEAALKGIFINEGLLNRVEMTIPFEILDRLNRFTFAINREGHTGIDRFAIEEYGAGSAGAFIASLFGSCKS